jgi:hypothetical protein
MVSFIPRFFTAAIISDPSSLLIIECRHMFIYRRLDHLVHLSRLGQNGLIHQHCIAYGRVGNIEFFLDEKRLF